MSKHLSENSIQEQPNEQNKKIDSLENKNDKDKGTTLSGNLMRMGSTALAFMIIGPIGGMIVGTLASVDYVSKGKFSEAGKEFFSGLKNVLENLFKGIESVTEKLALKEEQHLDKEIDSNKKSTELNQVKNLSPEIKEKAEEAAKGLKEGFADNKNINNQDLVKKNTIQQGRTPGT